MASACRRGRFGRSRCRRQWHLDSDHSSPSSSGHWRRGLGRAKDWLLTVEVAKALTAPRMQWDIAAWERRLARANYPYAREVLEVLAGRGCDIDPNPNALDRGWLCQITLRTGVQDAVARGD